MVSADGKTWKVNRVRVYQHANSFKFALTKQFNFISPWYNRTDISRKKNDWGLKYFVYKIGGKWAVSWWSGFCFFSSWISRWELPNYTSYILLSPIFHSESCLFQLSSLSLARLSGRLISFSAKENQKVARHYKTFKIIRKKIKKPLTSCVFIYIASFSSSIQLTTSIFVTAEIKVANSLFQQRTYLFYATSFYKRKFACLSFLFSTWVKRCYHLFFVKCFGFLQKVVCFVFFWRWTPPRFLKNSFQFW
jgi:hypothetical protein